MRTSEFSLLAPVAPWLSQAGPESDTVLACRIRLSRNLSERPYPGTPGNPDIEKTSLLISDAIRRELTPEPFGVDAYDVDPRTISEREVGLLTERSLVDDPMPSRLFLSGDESLSIAVGSIDHIRISGVAPGFALSDAMTTVQSVDCVLEHYLNYAVSLDWGYLSTDILNIGTAMRASVLFHLPALVALERMEPIRETLTGTGFELISPPAIGVEGSTSGLEILRNQRTLGSDEHEIVAKLEEYAGKLVHYERTAREELVANRGSEIADSAHRALGILRFARSLSATEARSMVSELRLGITAGVVDDVTAQTAAKLFHLIQDNHVIASRLRAGNLRGGDEDIQAARAAAVREALADA